ncbi:helix-turn-helix domain-containing protein [Roseitranquillus sediminis]|uniref:helix-turn-helix domain-containing protein n=1 Tax=Roseitranquillus sediminis TaxID=2809051 RepID=UPI001D0CBAEF|nr:LysR family transcriptional regulator [Roseitranquillus sediminis]
MFICAVRKGSLSAAARHLRLTAMSTTRRLVALEEDLGVRLLHRTSRSLALTPRARASSRSHARFSIHRKLRARLLVPQRAAQPGCFEPRRP